MNKLSFWLGLALAAMSLLYFYQNSQTEEATIQQKTNNRSKNKTNQVTAQKAQSFETRSSTQSNEPSPQKENRLPAMNQTDQIESQRIVDILNEMSRCLEPNEFRTPGTVESMSPSELLSSLTSMHGEPIQNYVDWETEEFLDQNQVVYEVRTDTYFNDQGQTYKIMEVSNKPRASNTFNVIQTTREDAVQQTTLKWYKDNFNSVRKKSNQTFVFSNGTKIELIVEDGNVKTLKGHKDLNAFDCNKSEKDYNCNCH